MRLFRFDADMGRPIIRFDSHNAIITQVLDFTKRITVNALYVEAGGVVGSHPAVQYQLFLVVHGEGWVKSDDTEKIPIKAGQAAFWEADEWHESGSDTGMTVIILEGNGIDPIRIMAEIDF